MKKNGEIVARRIAGDMILVPVRGNLADMQRIFSLTEVGAFIWELLDGNRSLADIGEAVSSRFALTREQAGADAASFLEELLREDLIS